MGAIVALRFDEPAGVHLSDSLGNLGDARTWPGLVEPPSVAAWSGSGRQFGGATAMITDGDLSLVGSLAVRDCTIQAIVTVSAAAAMSIPLSLVMRGSNDGTPADLACYGIEFVAGSSAGRIGLRWIWQNSAGAYKPQTAADFEAPTIGQFILITCTRRWESSTRVVLRYYVADELIAEVVSVDGDIAGGTTGKLSIGGRRNGASWDRFYVGTIDELIVYDHEATAAEVRHAWLTLDQYLDIGRLQVAALLPPGLDLDAPQKNTSRFVSIAGQAIGLLYAYNEGIRERYFPGSCDEDRMREWEFEYGINSRAVDSLDVRAQRVIAARSARKGKSKLALQELFAGPFDQLAVDVDIVELDNQRIEPWAAIDPAIWHPIGAGTWSVGPGTASSGAVLTDHRWAAHKLTMLRSSIVSNSMDVAATMPILARALGLGCFAGLALVELVNWTGVAFGVRRDAILGYRVVVMRLYNGSVVVTDDCGPASAETYLRIRPPFGSFALLPANAIEFGHCATAGEAANNAYATRNVSGIANPQWIGPMVNSEGVFSSALTIGSMRWIDRASTDVFRWYAYRDPLLPGNPDMEFANRLARRVSPSHGEGHAVSSLEFAAGVPGLGRVPMGAIRRR